MFDLVVRGDVVTPRAVLPGHYLSIMDGRIVAITARDPGVAHERLNADGAYVFPGAVDAQVHSRSQKGSEGLANCTRAAAAGGVTTIVEMPYDEGLLVCSGDAVRSKVKDVEAEAHVDVALYGTVHPDDGVDKIAEQIQAGVCGFKFSTFGTDPVRFPRIPPWLMRDAFAAIAPSGLAAGVHNENHETVAHDLAQVKAAGLTDYTAHGKSHTDFAEALAMAEIYEIGAYTGCRAHVVHCSMGRGIEICESYRRQGFAASVEVCIHYLVFSEDEDVARVGGLGKINPPIRTSRERESLWKHLVSGNIDMVSTDHVAWSLDRKNDPDMLKNASGGPSIEVMVPVLIKQCMVRGVDLSVAARVLSANPASHFRLAPRKGALTPGTEADFSIIDPSEAHWSVENSETVSDWSLYNGMSLPQVKATYLRGQKVWDGKQVVVDQGFGGFVKPFGRA